MALTLYMCIYTQSRHSPLSAHIQVQYNWQGDDDASPLQDDELELRAYEPDDVKYDDVQRIIEDVMAQVRACVVVGYSALCSEPVATSTRFRG